MLDFGINMHSSVWLFLISLSVCVGFPAFMDSIGKRNKTKLEKNHTEITDIFTSLKIPPLFVDTFSVIEFDTNQTVVFYKVNTNKTLPMIKIKDSIVDMIEHIPTTSLNTNNTSKSSKKNKKKHDNKSKNISEEQKWEHVVSDIAECQYIYCGIINSAFRYFTEIKNLLLANKDI